MEQAASPSFLKKWLIAGRPWALPASTMPVIFGTSLAVVIGKAAFLPGRFFLALIAMVVLHTAANMLSDVFDFKRGLDRNVTPVSGALVRGWLSPRQVSIGAGVLFAAGCAIGLYLVHLTGPVLLIIGVAGVMIGVFYSGLKVHALGDLAVFLNFGIFGSLGAWVVQTRAFSWIPVVWTVPMALLVSAILHANNWRDTAMDKEKKISTVASLLGDKRSLFYYGFLIFGPFVIDLILIIGPRLAARDQRVMPLTFLVVFLALPRAMALWGRARRRRAPRRPLDFIILDGATAQYNLSFGLLSTAALWLDFILNVVK
ncbi:MAG: prenyltransferase [Clostridiales bacterium]|nr:prenyltransferase [Clostridiales bacterium]